MLLHYSFDEWLVSGDLGGRKKKYKQKTDFFESESIFLKIEMELAHFIAGYEYYSKHSVTSKIFNFSPRQIIIR